VKKNKAFKRNATNGSSAGRYRRTNLNGVDCVVVQYEAVVNIGQLRANLAQFKIEEAVARKKILETELMLAQVEALAPDLLAASDAAARGSARGSAA